MAAAVSTHLTCRSTSTRTPSLAWGVGGRQTMGQQYQHMYGKEQEEEEARHHW